MKTDTSIKGTLEQCAEQLPPDFGKGPDPFCLWKPIQTAPRCDDKGRRPVLVTRWPITGHHAPMAVARLTREGWITGKQFNKLWFVPTHWQPLPAPPSQP